MPKIAVAWIGSYGNPGRFCFGVGFRDIVTSWEDLMVLGYPLRLLRSVAKDGSHAFAFDG